MSRCTVWPPTFRKWFINRFGDLCIEHDRKYMLLEGSKWDADMELAKAIWKRGYKTLAIGTWFFCYIVGWWYWIKK